MEIETKTETPLPENPVTLKITLIGKDKVGKSALAQRWKTDTYEKVDQPTIGINFYKLSRNKKNEALWDKIPTNIVSIDLWDTAGQTRFRSLLPGYLRGSDIVGIVVTPGDLEEKDLKDYYNEAKLLAGNASIYIIVNKIDAVGTPEEKEIWGNKPVIRSAVGIGQVINTHLPDIDNNHILFCSGETNEKVQDVLQTMANDPNANLQARKKEQKAQPATEMASAQKIKTFIEVPSRKPTVIEEIKDFFSEHKTWMRVNGILILGIAITLIALATLPVGGAFVLGLPFTVLTLASIISAAAFLAWNVGCAIGNWLQNRPPKITSYQKNEDIPSSDSSVKMDPSQPKPTVHPSLLSDATSHQPGSTLQQPTKKNEPTNTNKLGSSGGSTD